MNIPLRSQCASNHTHTSLQVESIQLSLKSRPLNTMAELQNIFEAPVFWEEKNPPTSSCIST